MLIMIMISMTMNRLKRSELKTNAAPQLLLPSSTSAERQSFKRGEEIIVTENIVMGIKHCHERVNIVLAAEHCHE